MIKVTDLAYARFRAPDLDVMEAFLVDFGLVRSARTDTALYMRATDEDHHVHVTETRRSSLCWSGFLCGQRSGSHNSFKSTRRDCRRRYK